LLSSQSSLQHPHKGSALLKLIRPQEVRHPLVPLKSQGDPGNCHAIDLAKEVTPIHLVHVTYLIFFKGTSLKPSTLQMSMSILPSTVFWRCFCLSTESSRLTWDV